MYKFIKLNYEINVSWVADSYQLTCTGSPNGMFLDVGYEHLGGTHGRITWVIDFRNVNTNKIIINNCMIAKPRSNKGSRFYDGICQADGSNTYLSTDTTDYTETIPYVYPVYYSSGTDGDYFVGDSGTWLTRPSSTFTCHFDITNQRKLSNRDIDIWGTNDVIPVSHVFTFDNTAAYNNFLTMFGGYAEPCYSNRFTWFAASGYLPEHRGFVRSVPAALPSTICKMYIGDDLVDGLWVGDDPVLKGYFRNNVVWQKEVY